MRVLCVENGPIVARGPQRLINRHSAKFHIELAERYPGLGVAQVLVEWDAKDTLADFDLAACPNLAVHALPWSAGTRAGRLASYARSFPWVLSVVSRFDYLYIFLPGHLSLLFVLAAKILRRPYGAYLRGSLNEWTGHPEAGPMRWALRNARFILATGDKLRDQARNLGAPAEAAVPMLELGPSDLVDPTMVRQEPPWKLLFVGLVGACKGVPELISGVRILGERGVRVELDVVGAGSELEAIRESASDIDNVRFRGVVSDRQILAAFFRDADLFVLPTHAEGFPRVLYEAMTYGTPVATTFVGSIPSLMVEGENCLRLEVKDASRLADTVQTALGSTSLRLRLAVGGTATMRRLFGEWKQTHAGQVMERIGR
jgi:glycosyltransferase involved in cell wall biosynthesis